MAILFFGFFSYIAYHSFVLIIVIEIQVKTSICYSVSIIQNEIGLIVYTYLWFVWSYGIIRKFNLQFNCALTEFIILCTLDTGLAVIVFKLLTLGLASVPTILWFVAGKHEGFGLVVSSHCFLLIFLGSSMWEILRRCAIHIIFTIVNVYEGIPDHWRIKFIVQLLISFLTLNVDAVQLHFLNLGCKISKCFAAEFVDFRFLVPIKPWFTTLTAHSQSELWNTKCSFFKLNNRVNQMIISINFDSQLFIIIQNLYLLLWRFINLVIFMTACYLIFKCAYITLH